VPEQHGSPRPTDAETALRQQTQVLSERIKELQCLYAIAALVAKPHITLEALCQGIVQVMPPAWHTQTSSGGVSCWAIAPLSGGNPVCNRPPPAVPRHPSCDALPRAVMEREHTPNRRYGR
jgi:hypothetical protein